MIIVSGVYVLQLENGKYYIGSSQDLDHRLAKHNQGSGAVWTRLHKCVDVILYKPTHPELLDAKEKEITLDYMRKYGWENVRGSAWCCTEMKVPPSEL